MAGLCWVVALTFSLSVGNSVAVDQNSLTQIVAEIEYRYFIPNVQFSLAANIPVDQNKRAKAFDKDDPAVVSTTVLSGDVYEGTNLVEATFKRDPGSLFTEHAEYRVLAKIQPLVDRSNGNILILYSYLSPCGAKCASKVHPFNILDKIKNDISKSKWQDVAFVFNKVFDTYPDGTAIPPAEIQETLQNIGGAGIGRGNIFRCYNPDRSGFTCIKCYSNEKFSAECLSNWV